MTSGRTGAVTFHDSVFFFAFGRTSFIRAGVSVSVQTYENARKSVYVTCDVTRTRILRSVLSGVLTQACGGE